MFRRGAKPSPKRYLSWTEEDAEALIDMIVDLRQRLAKIERQVADLRAGEVVRQAMG